MYTDIIKKKLDCVTSEIVAYNNLFIYFEIYDTAYISYTYGQAKILIKRDNRSYYRSYYEGKKRFHYHRWFENKNYIKLFVNLLNNRLDTLEDVSFDLDIYFYENNVNEFTTNRPYTGSFQYLFRINRNVNSELFDTYRYLHSSFFLSTFDWLTRDIDLFRFYIYEEDAFKVLFFDAAYDESPWVPSTDYQDDEDFDSDTFLWVGFTKGVALMTEPEIGFELDSRSFAYVNYDTFRCAYDIRSDYYRVCSRKYVDLTGFSEYFKPEFRSNVKANFLWTNREVEVFANKISNKLNSLYSNYFRHVYINNTFELRQLSSFNFYFIYFNSLRSLGQFNCYENLASLLKNDEIYYDIFDVHENILEAKYSLNQGSVVKPFVLKALDTFDDDYDEYDFNWIEGYRYYSKDIHIENVKKKEFFYNLFLVNFYNFIRSFPRNYFDEDTFSLDFEDEFCLDPYLRNNAFDLYEERDEEEFWISLEHLEETAWDDSTYTEVDQDFGIAELEHMSYAATFSYNRRKKMKEVYGFDIRSKRNYSYDYFSRSYFYELLAKEEFREISFLKRFKFDTMLKLEEDFFLHSFFVAVLGVCIWVFIVYFGYIKFKSLVFDPIVLTFLHEYLFYFFDKTVEYFPSLKKALKEPRLIFEIWLFWLNYLFDILIFCMNIISIILQKLVLFIVKCFK